MNYFDYSFSAATQAAFFKAEAELLKFDFRFARSPFASYMKEALMALDAVFAIRTARGVALPIVPLITAHSLTDWKHHGDTVQAIRSRSPLFRFKEDDFDAALEALHYMQTLEWISRFASSGKPVTLETVLRLHEMLLNGIVNDGRYHGFRNEDLPGRKGFSPDKIPSAVNDLCGFINTDSFSPLGQASAIHHSFERIVPFDTFVDRTGLVLAFLSMSRRGLFANGYNVPICWGASINPERRWTLRNSARSDPRQEEYLNYREYWAVHNARNTYLSVVIADSALDTAERVHAEWMSQGFQAPANSALRKLLDLFLAVPALSIGRASVYINKSYGATNEAMRQLTQAGIIREVALDGRERVFICDRSVAMIDGLVNRLIALGNEAESSETGRDGASWTRDAEAIGARARAWMR